MSALTASAAPSDDELWDDDDLLATPEPLPYEPEGPITDDERLDDLEGLLEDTPPALDPRWDEDVIGDDGDDFEDLQGLLAEDAPDALGGWPQESDEAPEPTQAPPPAVDSTPPAWRLAPSAAEPGATDASALPAVTVGYRITVDLPELEITGVPGRCTPQRAYSQLRMPLRGDSFRTRVKLRVAGRDLSLPLIDAEGPAVALRLVVSGREIDATLRLCNTESGVHVMLGRDALAAGALVIDVRQDAS